MRLYDKWNAQKPMAGGTGKKFTPLPREKSEKENKMEKIEKALRILVEARDARALLIESVAVNGRGVAYISLPHPYVIYALSITLRDIVDIIKDEFPNVSEVVAHFRGKLNMEGCSFQAQEMSVEEEKDWARCYFSRSMCIFPSIPGLRWTMEEV